jgi:hypothetical protein
LSFEEKGLEIDMDSKDQSDHQNEEISEQQNDVENRMWNMSFDGDASREGARVGVWINLP